MDTIISKLKAEIERRLKILREDDVVRQNCTSDFLEGKIHGYETLLSFLSTLESEKPIPSDLEEAAKEFAKTTFKKPYSDNPDEEVTIVEPASTLDSSPERNGRRSR